MYRVGQDSNSKECAILRVNKNLIRTYFGSLFISDLFELRVVVSCFSLFLFNISSRFKLLHYHFVAFSFTVSILLFFFFFAICFILVILLSFPLFFCVFPYFCLFCIYYYPLLTTYKLVFVHYSLHLLHFKITIYIPRFEFFA